MAARLATRTGTLTAEQAVALDAIGVAILALNDTYGWDEGCKNSPYATVTLAAKQALRKTTTYPMTDKVMLRFLSRSASETLSQSFRFAHIGWK